MAFWVGRVAAYDMSQYICSLNEGDWWEGLNTYSFVGGPADGTSGSYLQKLLINGTELVNGVETIKREVMDNGSVERYYCVALDSEGFKLYKEYQPAFGNYYVFDPSALVSPATFEEVGDVINLPSHSVLIYSIATDAHTDTATASGTISLESVEPVTVPAGTFKDCLKISNSSSSQSPTSGIATEFEQTFWYAYRVGRVKEEATMSWLNIPETGDMVLTVTWELTDYDVNFADGCPMTFALGGDSNDLNTLRKFRDEVLRKTPVGQEIIKLYYELSPVIVKTMAEDKEFKEEVKDMIERVLPLVRKAVE
jgi:hypothetical protein